MAQPSASQIAVADALEKVFWDYTVAPNVKGYLDDREVANQLLFKGILNTAVSYQSAMGNSVDVLLQRAGGSDIVDVLSGATVPEIEALIRGTQNQKSLHRFPGNMAKRFHASAVKLRSDWGGDFRKLWQSVPTGQALMRDLQAFSGISQKVAALLARLIAYDNGAVLADGLKTVPVPYDTHVLTVFPRSGLTGPRPSEREVNSTASTLRPDNPAVLDGAWFIGMQYCHKTNPECADCLIANVCPKLV